MLAPDYSPHLLVAPEWGERPAADEAVRTIGAHDPLRLPVTPGRAEGDPFRRHPDLAHPLGDVFRPGAARLPGRRPGPSGRRRTAFARMAVIEQHDGCPGPGQVPGGQRAGGTGTDDGNRPGGHGWAGRRKA